MYYYNSHNIQNFGDIINPLIVSHVYKTLVIRKNLNSATLVAIGSVLNGITKGRKTALKQIKKYIRPTLDIWGSGLMVPPADDSFLSRKIKIHALRGTYTRDCFAKLTNIDLSLLPLGDPGLLASKLLDKLPEKKYKVGIICHYVDQNDPAVNDLKDLHSSTTIIPILGDPIETLYKIAECEIILSSAMHGLIAADSLNIPNQWLRFSDQVAGGDFKFNDYYSVFNLKPDVWDVRTKKITRQDVLSIPTHYKITADQIVRIQDSLVKAFPYS